VKTNKFAVNSPKTGFLNVDIIGRSIERPNAFFQCEEIVRFYFQIGPKLAGDIALSLLDLNVHICAHDRAMHLELGLPSALFTSHCVTITYPHTCCVVISSL